MKLYGHFLRVGVLVSVVGVLSSHTAVALSFTVEAIGTFGGNYSRAAGVNEFGQVSGVAGEGYSPTGLDQRAFLYDGSSGLTNLGLLPFTTYSNALAINDLGQVVGWSGSSAFITVGSGPSRSMVDLGALAGGETRAYGVNNLSQVVGNSRLNSLETHAFLSDGTGDPGSMIDLGTLGGEDSTGYGINDQGWVVGASQTDTGVVHAFLSDGTPGGMVDIHTVGGGSSVARDINELGQVVGTYDNRAFRYEAGTGMVDLGVLGGEHAGSITVANSINDYGWIVGQSSSGSGPGGGFVYIEEMGGMLNINDYIDPASGWRFYYASDVNNSGQIVGYGSNGSGVRAILLTPDTLPGSYPIPEPATTALFCLGLGGILVRRRLYEG